MYFALVNRMSRTKIDKICKHKSGICGELKERIQNIGCVTINI